MFSHHHGGPAPELVGGTLASRRRHLCVPCDCEGRKVLPVESKLRVLPQSSSPCLDAFVSRPPARQTYLEVRPACLSRDHSCRRSPGACLLCHFDSASLVA